MPGHYGDYIFVSRQLILVNCYYCKGKLVSEREAISLSVFFFLSKCKYFETIIWVAQRQKEETPLRCMRRRIEASESSVYKGREAL
jgi:hypothetical protein